MGQRKLGNYSKPDKMVFKGAIDAKRRAYITFLSREKQIPVSEISRKCNISRATIYRLIKEDYSGDNKSVRDRAN